MSSIYKRLGLTILFYNGVEKKNQDFYPYSRERKSYRLTLHGPVVDSGFRDKSYRVQVNPLPEYDVISHLVCLHLALHLDVEDLQVLASCNM